MRLCLIIDDYMPHSTRVGAKMIHDLAIELLQKGHTPIVITPHFKKTLPRLVKEEIEGVKVWRFRSGRIKDVNKITRAFNESLLSIRAWLAINSQIKDYTFDGIIFYSPSIFFGPLVSKIKSRCGCTSYLILRDFFPQWAVDSKLIQEDSYIEKYFRYFEKITYDSANTIGVMSENNLKLFNKNTKNRYTTSILRNWTSVSSYKKIDEKINLRHIFNLDDTKVIFFYGGNIGHAQDMPNLMRLVRSMNEHKEAHFIFVGQGDEVDFVNKYATKWSLKNFNYMPSVSQEKFKMILREVDIGLFSLSAKHKSHNFPGKLLAYMANSIPILGSVNLGNDLIELYSKRDAGLISINGQDSVLLDNAIKLLNNPIMRDRIGNSGYALMKDEFSVSKISNEIIESLGVYGEKA